MNNTKNSSITSKSAVTLLIVFIIFLAATSVLATIKFRKHYDHLHEAVEVTATVNRIIKHVYEDINDDSSTEERIAYLTYAYKGKIYEDIEYTEPVSPIISEGDRMTVRILDSNPTELFSEETGDVYLTIASAFFSFTVIMFVTVIITKKRESLQYPRLITVETVWQDTKPPMALTIAITSQAVSLFAMSVFSGKCIKPFYLGNIIVYAIAVILLLFQVKAARKYSMTDYTFTRDLSYLANIPQTPKNTNPFVPQEGHSYILMLDKNYVPVRIYEEPFYQYAYEYNEEYAKKRPLLQFIHAVVSSLLIGALFVIYCTFALRVF